MKKKKIIEFLIELRKSKNLTQDELAKHLNVDRTTVSKWERGIYIPNVETLIQLADFFDVSVNEIILGERATKSNEKEFEDLPISILKESNSKMKKMTVLFIFFFILFACIIFAIYFINNYKSIKVYTISGESDNYLIIDGLMIVSKEKSYIKIGDIIPINDMDYNSYKLYYMKNGEEEIILNDSVKLENTIVNNYSYNEYFSYSEIDDFINNLFLDICNDNNCETIHFIIRRDLINNKLIYQNNNTSIGKDIEKINNNLSDYIIDNFVYEESSNKYVYQHNDNEYEYIESYAPDTLTFYLNIKNNNKEYFYILDNITSYLYYENINDNYTIEYILDKDKCLTNNCDIYKDKINFFIDNYLDKITKK